MSYVHIYVYYEFVDVLVTVEDSCFRVFLLECIKAANIPSERVVLP